MPKKIEMKGIGAMFACQAGGRKREFGDILLAVLVRRCD